ncbi:tetratricopeptide repeat protein [Streptomyces sulphureus]|uniref:tetratricopeptide repeat protein n=1 Tax=Streptomyces sulphureus TaxID=47758 RepID=UPI00037F55FA|nr:tetratricopeptide repeat protein [Streptomyces sulphureus]
MSVDAVGTRAEPLDADHARRAADRLTTHEREEITQRIAGDFLLRATAAERLLTPWRNTARQLRTPDPFQFHDAGAARQWLAGTVDDLARLVEQGERDGRDAFVWQVVHAFYPHWRLARPLTLARQVHERALRAAQRDHARIGEQEIRTTLAAILRRLGDHRAALTMSAAARESALQDGDRRAQAHATHQHGHILLASGDPRAALSYLHMALTMRRDLYQDAHDHARRHRGAGADEVRTYRRAVGLTLTSIGVAEAATDPPHRLTTACRRLRDAIDILQEVGDEHDAGRALAHLGAATAARGHGRSALRLFDRAEELFSRSGSRTWWARARLMRAQTLAAAGQQEAAQIAFAVARDGMGPDDEAGLAAEGVSLHH